MPHVEDDRSLRAGEYQRPLSYTYDSSLAGGQGGFHYVFEEGFLSCSVAAQAGQQICLVSRREQSTIGSGRPSFVYLDCGSWVDNADGNNTRRRDFGLVCGRNIYLCEFVRDGGTPTSRIPSVQDFFTGFGAQPHCGLRVIKYAEAGFLVADATVNDPSLYLFLADLHLPPVTWVHDRMEVSTHVLGGPTYAVPAWLDRLAALRRQPDHLYRNYYSLAESNRREGRRRLARGPTGGNPDIFGTAGSDLAIFVNALRSLNQGTKRLLHFIQLGDMLELWVGRDYQFVPGSTIRPRWADEGTSPNLAANWALETMIQNTPVFEALRTLQGAGLAEVKYVWGNHDAYTMSRRVTEQLELLSRDPVYRGLNGDILAEHGHRFDRSNFDNLEYQPLFSAPAVTNLTYLVPVARRAEPTARTFTSIGHPSAMLDCYLLGATLLYLNQRYDQQQHPFSVYIMGHSHCRQLFTFQIRVEYHLYGVP